MFWRFLQFIYWDCRFVFICNFRVFEASLDNIGIIPDWGSDYEANIVILKQINKRKYFLNIFYINFRLNNIIL